MQALERFEGVTLYEVAGRHILLLGDNAYVQQGFGFELFASIHIAGKSVTEKLALIEADFLREDALEIPSAFSSVEDKKGLEELKAELLKANNRVVKLGNLFSIAPGHEDADTFSERMIYYLPSRERKR